MYISNSRVNWMVGSIESVTLLEVVPGNWSMYAVALAFVPLTLGRGSKSFYLYHADGSPRAHKFVNTTCPG